MDTPAPAPAPQAPAATTLEGPKIHFDSTIFDFGRAMSGEAVKHDFYFTNVGTTDLVVSNVAPQCGCTAAGQWTHEVHPGGTGVIPIQFNTANYNSPVTKVITVTSNDKSQQLVPLQLKGTVWKPVSVTPQVAVINVRSEVPFAQTVARITNSLDEMLWLSPPESNHKAFGAEIRTNVPGREYLLVISNNYLLPPGAVQGQITMKTSLTNIPTIQVLAYANMQAALTISPPQLMLPPAPIPTNQCVRYITIINNSTNPLTLSETSINATNVSLSVQPLQAGKYYTVTMTFPPDFSLEPGQTVAFSTRTSSPQFEKVTVPVYQTPKTAPQARVANQRPTMPAPPGAAVLRRPPPSAPRPLQPPPIAPAPSAAPVTKTPEPSAAAAAPPVPPSQ